MMAISLWQPHATLFAIGARQIETRGDWVLSRKYRGKLLIHAAKRWNSDIAMDYKEAGRILRENGYKPETPEQIRIYSTPGKDLCGCLLAIGDLYDIKPIPDVPEEGFDRFFGLFGPGRAGLFLRNLRPVLPLIPFAGKQGFFDVPDELVKECL